MEGTIKYRRSRPSGNQDGIIQDFESAWRFGYDPTQIPAASSRRKQIFCGTFVDALHPEGIAARAVAFGPTFSASFGVECANLGLLSTLGVGPKLLAITQHDFCGTGTRWPTILEEDAGESLANVLRGARMGSLPGSLPILHPTGTPERTVENKKVLYDVYVQVMNAHGAGIYHRDLRCENVCVRRFGPEPADIRATVIDFELGGALCQREAKARAPLYHTLFCEAPSLLARQHVAFAPNPLELDMGYLAALSYHLDCGATVLNGAAHSVQALEAFLRYVTEHVTYFGYPADGTPPFARRLELSLDVDGIARDLHLTKVDELTFASTQLLVRARGFCRPYLDKEALVDCMNTPEAKLDALIDRLAVAAFETYKMLRRAQGKTVPFERFEDQPDDLRRSDHAQAEHIPQKVRALGYELVVSDGRMRAGEVNAFNDRQIELLARLEHDRWIEERLQAGWTLDATAKASDPVARTSPYLVPYEELDEDVKEYDRDAARQLIPLIKRAGLALVRPGD
ncbi:MAG: hypothetical protein IKF14_05485 [Atopobiaceae bacterium]|nr:hypothetical protein [Atopobiaceae bacterium]